MDIVQHPVWGRRSTFSEADFQIEGLQWSRIYFGNAAEAVGHVCRLSDRYGARSRRSPMTGNGQLESNFKASLNEQLFVSNRLNAVLHPSSGTDWL
jgi:hypothetical protein